MHVGQVVVAVADLRFQARHLGKGAAGQQRGRVEAAEAFFPLAGQKGVERLAAPLARKLKAPGAGDAGVVGAQALGAALVAQAAAQGVGLAVGGAVGQAWVGVAAGAHGAHGALVVILPVQRELVRAHGPASGELRE